MLRATAERMGITFERCSRVPAREILVRRVGQPEDVATMASFFCSEGAGFVSGQVVYPRLQWAEGLNP
jgi:3-oxoacyl-[acyl-carrier protein] reductase